MYFVTFPTEPSAVRYALDLYSETQYNSFGWARYAGVLTKSELDDLYAKIQARMTLRTYKQSSRGEAIIEVNNTPHTTLGVDNVFVFVKGSKNDFKITRVVRFNAETETEMEIIKEELYERGTWSDSYLPYYERENISKEYRGENSKSFEQYQQEVRSRSGRQESRGTDRDNRRSKKYGSGYSLVIGEDGEIISETFKRNALPEGDFDAQRVVRLNAETETEMEIIKEELYERGTCSDTYLALYQKQGVAREYREENYPTFAKYREGRSNGEESRGTDRDNRRSKKYGSGYSLVIGEDGEIISETFKRNALPEGDFVPNRKNKHKI